MEVSLVTADITPPKEERRVSGLLSDAVVLKAIAHIEADYSAPLTLATISDAVGLSPFHFHRRFSEVMGETVADYVRRVRMEHAAVHVCRTPLPLIDATFRFGYGSQEAFTRAYVQRFGMTPGRMRTLSRETLAQAARRDMDWADMARSKELSAIPLIGLRFVGAMGDVNGCWRTLATLLHEAGFSLDKVRAVGIHYDDPTFAPIDAMRYDCCIIDEGFPAQRLPPPLRRLSTRPGLYGTLTRAGSSTVVVEAITSVVLGWVPVSRHGLGDTVTYEFHHDPPWISEGKHLTVCVPLV